MKEIFRRIATATSEVVGSAWSFIVAILIIVIWALSGPMFSHSDTWQLVINTGTTIITFLVVFMIQNTQNRDSQALHLKLDELIRVSRARNLFASLEDASDEELISLQKEFETLRQRGSLKRSERREKRKTV